jgi:hypothetical protein
LISSCESRNDVVRGRLSFRVSVGVDGLGDEGDDDEDKDMEGLDGVRVMVGCELLLEPQLPLCSLEAVGFGFEGVVGAAAAVSSNGGRNGEVTRPDDRACQCSINREARRATDGVFALTSRRTITPRRVS